MGIIRKGNIFKKLKEVCEATKCDASFVNLYSFFMYKR